MRPPKPECHFKVDHFGIFSIADHFGIFSIFSAQIQQIELKFVETRSFKPANIQHFNDLLSNVDFSEVLSSACPNTAYNEFMELFPESFEIAFPMRKILSERKRMKSEPWITTGILESSKMKSKLFLKKLNNPSLQNSDNYKAYLAC